VRGPTMSHARPSAEHLAVGTVRSRGAIVIGASYRALGVVRSLGRLEIPVAVLKDAADADLLATTSRYVSRTLTLPPGSEAQKIDFLLSAAIRYGLAGWALIPTDDKSARLAACHHEALSSLFRMTTSPWAVLRWAYDKRLTCALARDLGVDQPWTLCPTSRNDLVSIDCRFPVILKPAYKQSLNAFTVAKGWLIENRDALLKRYDEASALVDPATLMVQEMVPGGGDRQFSYAALVNEGRPLAWLTARRTRQIPMGLGRFSTYVETVNEPAVVRPSIRLLEAIRFTGLVEIEFKHDLREGRYKLLDINPRIWGWYTLCARAGLDFTWLLWLMIHGEPVPPTRARPDVRWMRTGADVTVALQEMLRGRLSLWEYLRSLRHPVEHAIFSPTDPLPALLALPALAYKLGRRALNASHRTTWRSWSAAGRSDRREQHDNG